MVEVGNNPKQTVKAVFLKVKEWDISQWHAKKILFSLWEMDCTFQDGALLVKTEDNQEHNYQKLRNKWMKG